MSTNVETGKGEGERWRARILRALADLRREERPRLAGQEREARDASDDERHAPCS